MQKPERQKGFTLIETLVYLALFALIMSGAFAGAYQLIEHSNRTRTQVVRNEELQFIMRKIDWALTSAETISEPGEGEERDLLIAQGSYGTLRFKHEGNAILLDGVELSSSRVDITSFNVKRDGGIQVSISIDNMIFATSTRYLYE